MRWPGRGLFLIVGCRQRGRCCGLAGGVESGEVAWVRAGSGWLLVIGSGKIEAMASDALAAVLHDARHHTGDDVLGLFKLNRSPNSKPLSSHFTFVACTRGPSRRLR